MGKPWLSELPARRRGSHGAEVLTRSIGHRSLCPQMAPVSCYLLVRWNLTRHPLAVQLAASAMRATWVGHLRAQQRHMFWSVATKRDASGPVNIIWRFGKNWHVLMRGRITTTMSHIHGLLLGLH